jgi:hypothetical protein
MDKSIVHLPRLHVAFDPLLGEDQLADCLDLMSREAQQHGGHVTAMRRHVTYGPIIMSISIEADAYEQLWHSLSEKVACRCKLFTDMSPEGIRYSKAVGLYNRNSPEYCNVRPTAVKSAFRGTVQEWLGNRRKAQMEENP